MTIIVPGRNKQGRCGPACGNTLKLDFWVTWKTDRQRDKMTNGVGKVWQLFYWHEDKGGIIGLEG